MRARRAAIGRELDDAVEARGPHTTRAIGRDRVDMREPRVGVAGERLPAMRVAAQQAPARRDPQRTVGRDVQRADVLLACLHLARRGAAVVRPQAAIGRDPQPLAVRLARDREIVGARIDRRELGRYVDRTALHTRDATRERSDPQRAEGARERRDIRRRQASGREQGRAVARGAARGADDRVTVGERERARLGRRVDPLRAPVLEAPRIPTRTSRST